MQQLPGKSSASVHRHRLGREHQLRHAHRLTPDLPDRAVTGGQLDGGLEQGPNAAEAGTSPEPTQFRRHGEGVQPGGGDLRNDLSGVIAGGVDLRPRSRDEGAQLPGELDRLLGGLRRTLECAGVFDDARIRHSVDLLSVVSRGS